MGREGWQELRAVRSVCCLVVEAYQQLVKKLATSFPHLQAWVVNSEVPETLVFVPVALA